MKKASAAKSAFIKEGVSWGSLMAHMEGDQEGQGVGSLPERVIDGRKTRKTQNQFKLHWPLN